MATATTTAVAQLNRVQYVGLDFPTHFDDLRSELQTKFAADFNDFALSSLAIMLLDVTAYGLDTLSFYLDRRATDSYLETAQTRKAVARLTRQLGYKMGGAVSASTDLSVRITQAVNFIVTIPQGFQFKGPNSLIFEAAQETTYAPRSTTAQLIPVYEGETITETFVGDGTANQVYQLQAVPAGKSVVQGSAKVYVNGTPYTEADFLPITGGQYFEIGYNDSPATLRFGDGTVSQSDIPALNSTISVTYIAAAGLAGQVNANTITGVVTPLVVNFNTISLAINNPEAAVGGDDPESLARAKALAPLVYKSRYVAVTRSDYVALASAYADPLFGRVSAAQAYSTRSAEDDTQLQVLLQDVRDVTDPVYASVIAQLTALETQTSAIDAAVTSSTGYLGDVATSTTTINTDVGTAITTLEGVSNKADLATSRCTTGATTVGAIPGATGVNLQVTVSYTQPALLSNVTVTLNSVTGLTIGSSVVVGVSGTAVGTYTVVSVPTTTSATLTLTVVGSVAPAGTVTAPAALTSSASDQLTTATKSSLLSIFAALGGTDIATMKSDTDAAIGDLQSAITEVTAIGTTTSTGYLLLLTNQNTAISAATTVIGQAATLPYAGTIAPAIRTAVTPLSPTGSGTGTINAALDAIEAHVDAILAADCSANLVTVPILTKDANGFYSAPSLGLRTSLEAYLNERKAVTQTIQVVSGEAALIYAVLTIQVAVSAGFAENVVRLAVETAIDGILKGRQFGASLYRSEITETCLAVAGVSHVNPTINGYTVAGSATIQTDKLDGYGNLVIDESEVVTKNSVTVTTVPLT